MRFLIEEHRTSGRSEITRTTLVNAESVADVLRMMLALMLQRMKGEKEPTP